MKAVYLNTSSSFNTNLRSDTLWGLIISALSVLKPKSEIDEIINQFKSNNPSFAISSAFSYSIGEDNKIVHFFPKPIVCNFDYNIDSAWKMTIYKKFKKINFVNENVFQDLINGIESDKDLFQKFIKLNELENKGANLNDDEKKNKKKLSLMFMNPFFKKELILHNTIDRMSGSTLDSEDGGQLFHSEDTFIEKNSGLYFLVDGDINIIEPALRFLSHFGFGGNNTTGKGFFKYAIKDFNLKVPTVNINSFITLSLFNPKAEELSEFLKVENKNKLWYETDFRAGRIGVHFADDPSKNQKNIVANFKEGSTFPDIVEKYPGRIIQTASSKSHDIFNYAFSFKISSNLKYE